MWVLFVFMNKCGSWFQVCKSVDMVFVDVRRGEIRKRTKNINNFRYKHVTFTFSTT